MRDSPRWDLAVAEFVFQNAWYTSQWNANCFSCFFNDSSFSFIYHGPHTNDQRFVTFYLFFVLSLMSCTPDFAPEKKKKTEPSENCACGWSRQWACCMQIGVYLSSRFAEDHTHIDVLSKIHKWKRQFRCHFYWQCLSETLKNHPQKELSNVELRCLLTISPHAFFFKWVIFINIHQPWHGFRGHFRTKMKNPRTKLT